MPAAEFNRKIRPVLETYCFDCHGGGENRGGVALDAADYTTNFMAGRDLWWRVLKNLQANLMPPANKLQPSRKQKEMITQWIKRSVFEINPLNPDPGRVTLRRLNRAEYQNTIRELVGVDFDAPGIFPPEDTGHGFDNLSDVLILSPMLLEKYVDAAEKIIKQAVLAQEPTPREPARPENHTRFFPKPVPANEAGRRDYARALLGDYARRAFRRPVDSETTNRLTQLAESVFDQPGKTFEAGVAKAMVAVLASPRFIFREETAWSESGRPGYALVDEYALASRLSYFLWSSMPDEDLFRLAAAGKLRKNLSSQLARMLADPRASALEHNFVGQWLQARDIVTVPIEAATVLAREQKPDPGREAQRQRFRELRSRPETTLTPEEQDELAKLRTGFRARRQSPGVDLSDAVRQAMRPIEQAVVMTAETPVSAALAVSRERKLTRLPVWEQRDGRQRVIGLLALNALLYQPNLDVSRPVSDYMKPALFLDEDVRLEVALRRLQRSGQRLAIVLSREQREIGILSLQDVLKFIFGEVSL